VNITYRVLAAFAFGQLLMTAGLADQHTVHDKSNNASAKATRPIASRQLNRNANATGAGHTNSNPTGLVSSIHSLRPTGSTLTQHQMASGLNQGRIAGTSFLRKGSGPAAVGGTVKNDGSINGTAFGPKRP